MTIAWREVARRAAGRCEYCRMHQSLQGATFHVEHIVPSSRGGPSHPDNLGWACPGCNLRKSDRMEARDPDTGAVAPMFNPRTDRWRDHLRWQAVGRATCYALDLNHPRRLRIREEEQLFALLPPPEP